ncbi:MAG: lysine--tRNA ligase [Elusimicrobia bacterium RIFCSPLOWO2_12_FULL_59_9]|nr:MAG: lysine--tRNA ligase [Elusimicrobia bacterium RIFCSPLOWO2_12_FULL_59_9]
MSVSQAESSPNPSEKTSFDEILRHKQEKIKELKARGVELYPHRYAKTHSARQSAESALESRVQTAGRVVLMRPMGKAAFAHLQDSTGKIQVYFKQDILGAEPYQLVKAVQAGDFVGVEGKIFKTKTGEITIQAESVTLLCKSLRPLPEKWHGLKDVETRYRSRHLDLLANPETFDTFRKRTVIIRAVRAVMDEAGFLEVETPVMLPKAGGAAAKPFVTHHNALDQDLVLRIATELYLKRLIVGGYERVYEIGRIFRNEGVDTRHNPEFSMMEAYQAYADYHTMRELVEKIFDRCSSALGVEQVEYRGRTLGLKPPFRALRLPEVWQEKCGEDIHQILAGQSFNRPALLALAARAGNAKAEELPSAKVFEQIFDAKILPELDAPTFLFDYPAAITPLAKSKPGDEALVERFEFFAAREEIANAYSELNDPEVQRTRLEEQLRQRTQEKDEEADILDEDFVQALECGMPPTGGVGIGIDRLVMILTGQASIRDVILFPTLKNVL